MAKSPATDGSIAVIDELLAGAGLAHGTRQSARRQSNPEAATSPPAKGRDPVVRGDPHSKVEVLRVPAWDKFAWLQHGFSTRSGGRTTLYRSGSEHDPGELNLGFNTADPDQNVLANRRIFLHSVTGERSSRLITLRQIHSTLIRRVDQGHAAPRAHLAGDGLMTNAPGVLLGIQTADCIPVLIADRKRRAVAAFHAGWRGTLGRIVQAGVGQMRLEFGSKPEDMVAAIGPGIGQCCYSVGEEVLHEFRSQFLYSEDLFREVYDADPIKEKYPMLFLTARAPGHSNLGPNLHLDLIEANRRQLVDAGLKNKSISIVGGCTSCQPERFFSHRGQSGFTGRMLAVVGVRAHP